MHGGVSIKHGGDIYKLLGKHNVLVDNQSKQAYRLLYKHNMWWGIIHSRSIDYSIDYSANKHIVCWDISTGRSKEWKISQDRSIDYPANMIVGWESVQTYLYIYNLC